MGEEDERLKCIRGWATHVDHTESRGIVDRRLVEVEFPYFGSHAFHLALGTCFFEQQRYRRDVREILVQFPDQLSVLSPVQS